VAPMLLKAEALIDGTGKPPLAKPLVIIDGDRIVRIGTENDGFDVPDNVEVVSLPGAWLLPGLIDAHSHVSMPGHKKHYRQRMSDDLQVRVITATQNMRRNLEGGVTTIRCMGDKDFVDIYIKRAIEAGEVPGPRILASGLGIRTSSAHGYVATEFDGEDEIRRAVRRNLARGADVIKIFTTGDPTQDVIDPCSMTADEIRAAVTEAHNFGKPVAAHCTGGPAFSMCIELGVDTIEHGFRVTDEDIERAVQAGATVGLTINTSLNDRRVANRFDGPIPDSEREKQAIYKETIKKYVEAGVTYILGTDAQHGELAFDLIFLCREIGVPAGEVLQIGTRRAAEVLGIEGQVGTVEEGKLADIIAVKGDPLQDIGMLESVEMVMKGGSLFKR